MKILVTGGAGFIGRNVVDVLSKRGYDIRVIDSLRDDVHHGIIPNFSKDIEFVHGDLRDESITIKAIKNIDGVIHLAGKVGLGVDIHDMIDYTSSNDLATAILLEAMAKENISKIVLASSMVVYGEGEAICSEHGSVQPGLRIESEMKSGNFEPPCPLCGKSLLPMSVKEDSKLDPRNTYASSKLAQENLCASWARLTNGVVGAMRYHNVYGPNMPRDTPYAGVAAIFLSSLRSGNAPKVFEDGGQRRDFIHVKDIARATIDCFEKHNNGFRAFNTGTGTIRTVGMMASELSKALKGKEPIVTGDFRLGDVRHITADSTRLITELDWKPEVDFDIGMLELANE